MRKICVLGIFLLGNTAGEHRRRRRERSKTWQGAVPLGKGEGFDVRRHDDNGTFHQSKILNTEPA